ncbi:hypothetical protein BGZ99_010044 [Dissophora globulifera]|uniref:Uncharacterized protein n=1 Tax=Dissophora globulifera TaxID=979702 RepID=A0A9P6V0I6_9FUNG|nr:hypothetical protein BGZ99_010044 [Dissophora globulifera]
MPSSVFLPITVFVLKIVLGIFRFLLVQAVGAGLAIYSKIGGDYANNIRWMRQGGYLEMITSLFTTREGLPGNARIALFVTIIASFVASILDTGVGLFILLDEKPIHPESMFTTMNNYAPSDGFYVYLRWTNQMYLGDNITARMDSIVNNPDSVEGDAFDSGRQYQVRKSDYNVQHCLAWDFLFPGAQYVYNSACATMNVGLDGFDINYSQANTTALRDGRWSISALMPLPTQQSLPQVVPAINATTYECGNGLAPLTDFYTDSSNLKQPPRTYTTKCVTNGGDITVLTYSSTRFKVKQASTYSAAIINVFQDTSDELLNTMQVSISNSPAQTLNTTLLMEIKISNLQADVLYCYTDTTDANSWSCGYLNINGFLLEKQELDPQTAAIKLAAHTYIGTPIVIEHIPRINNSVVAPFALQTLRDATADVAKYMASLGNNFVTEDPGDGDAPRHLFVFYEASTFKQGFVVPVWVLCFVGVLAAFAIGIWATAHFMLGEKYTTSFYKSVTKKVAAAAKKDTAALLKSVAVSIVKTGMELALDEGLDRLGDGFDGLGDGLDGLDDDSDGPDMTGRDVEKTASKKKAPASKKEVPASKKEVPASQKEVPASKKEVPASKKEVPASKKEDPASKKEVQDKDS